MQIVYMEWRIQFSYFLGNKKIKEFVVCRISRESGNPEVAGSIRVLVKIYYGLCSAYRILQTQKQNALHDNESSEDCSVSQ